jgi:NADPH2:quinone reductase
MKAHVINRYGDTSVFEIREVPKPALKPGHALVRVMATSVNPLDIKLRSGLLPDITPEFPSILHSDIAGIIEEVAPDVTSLQAGDHIFGCAGGVKGEGGALAEFMLVDVRLIAKKPASLSMSEAAALPLVSITAWEALFEKIKLAPGQNILIHGGTGGVGHIGIQLAKWAGANVYATVSSDEKGAIARALGADEIINYRTESVKDYVNRLTNGKGFDVVFDTVGGINIDNSIAAVAQYGDVVSILTLSTHDLSNLHLKSANFHAVFMLLPLLYNVQRERHGEILSRISHLVEEGRLQPLINPEQFSFDEIGKAHALLESGKATGKIVITREH